jgi:predicted amidophosphoribosyltransferase
MKKKTKDRIYNGCLGVEKALSGLCDLTWMAWEQVFCSGCGKPNKKKRGKARYCGFCGKLIR